MLLDSQRKMFAEFNQFALRNGIADTKTAVMIRMAAAMAIGCYPWIQQLLVVGKENGVTDEEIGAIELNVMVVSAGRVMAQVDEAVG